MIFINHLELYKHYKIQYSKVQHLVNEVIYRGWYHLGKNDRRIHELEEQIKQLTQQLESLIKEKETINSFNNTSETSTSISQVSFTDTKEDSHDRKLISDSPLLQKIKSAMKVENKEELEQKIGAIWASRIGALLVMTAVVLGARTTFYSTDISRWGKILLGYIFSIILIVAGEIPRKKNIFTEVLLSCGLAGIYFTTYAGLFLEETYLFPSLYHSFYSLVISFPILLFCLFPLIYIAHKRENSTIAGIGLFLTYYTVALSCYNEPNIRTLTYALLTSITIAFITFLFHLIHNWFFLSWTGVIASYATYIYVFLYLNPHTYFHIPEKTYFWISFLFLTTCFLLFSISCIVDARKRGEYRKEIAPLVGLNSAIYFCLTFYAIRVYYLPYEYLFRTGFTLMLLLFSLIAHFTGPKNNYIFQIFIIKTVIMTTLAIQSYFSGEKLLIALSIECLALAFAHKRSGYLVYRVLNFFLLWVAFFWGISYLKISGHILLAGYLIPANWFAIWGASAFLFITAWFYEHFIPLQSNNLPKWSYEIHFSSIHWKFSPLFMAVFHACCASLLILILTVIEYINDPQLPLILTTELLILLGIGLLFSTSAIQFSSVLLLVSAQVYYLFYFFTGEQSLYELPYFLSMSIPLAFISYVGAYVWERYFNKIHHQDDDVHFILTILPYISSIFITLIVVNDIASPIVFSVIVSFLGMCIYVLSIFNSLPSFSISGITLIFSSILYYLVYLTKLPEGVFSLPVFLTAIFLSTVLLLSERIKLYKQKRLLQTYYTDTILRLVFSGCIALVHLTFGYFCLPQHLLIFYYLVIGLCLLFTGMLLQESMYRWVGFCVLLVTLLRTFFVFQYISSEIYQILSFAVSALVLLFVGWIYSRKQTIE